MAYGQVTSSTGSPSLPIPGCLTPAQRKVAELECATQIKGLGMGPEFRGMDPCAAKMLPDCPRGRISSFLFPAQGVTAPVPGGDEAAQKRARLVVGGLLAVLLVGGGVVAYRVLKKKG